MLMKVIKCAYGLLVVINFFAPQGVAAQKQVFPYEINSWVIRDIPTGIAYGSALAGLYLLGDNLVSRAEAFDSTDLISSTEIGFFDRYATRQWSDSWDSFSDQLLWGMGAATAASLAVVLSNQEQVSGSTIWSNSATLALMAAELLVINKGLTDLVKGGVRRRRPYVHNQDLTFNQKFQIATEDQDLFLSFFSGHSAATFSAAAFISTVVADATDAPDWAKGLVWGSTMSVAALTAYARVAAGRHFPSDVIVGAIVGSAIGHLIPRSHRLGGDANVHITNHGYQGIGIGIQIPVS